VSKWRCPIKKGRIKISGQPVEYWLNILNQDTTQPILAIDTMVLMYKGQYFFFVDGGVCYWTVDKRPSYHLQKAFFLIAVGQSAVRLLSEQEQIFQRIAGSTELAAFSIFRWSDFAYILTAEKK